MSFRFGITEKIILAVIGLVVSLVMGIGYYAFDYQRGLLLAQFDQRAKIMVESLAASSEYPVLAGNEDMLKKIGEALLGRQDVLRCEIKDKEGRTLFEGTIGQEGRSARAYEAAILTPRVALSADEMVFLGAEEKALEKIGTVRLVMSLSGVTQEMAQQRNTILFFTFTGMGIIFFAIVFLMRTVLGRHMNRLMAGIRVLASGDLSHRIPVETHDEIGILALSFNKMAQDLQKVIVSRDELAKEIKERKRAEEEVTKAYAKLKATQAQLVQSSKMASVGLLAGGVAHEINNPLTGVLNNVQLVKMMAVEKEEFKIEEFREILDAIEEASNRCVRITRSLLDFSRASTGTLQAISVNGAIEKVCVLIEQEMRLENICIARDLAVDLPCIRGDEQLIQQLFLDLMSNAKWAIEQKSDKKDGTIFIRSAYEEKEGTVFISFSDTGIGIPPENIEQIFDPFFTTKSIGEGTGLGLSVIYRIVKQHGGSIEAKSSPGQGAAFEIRFPAIALDEKGPDK